MQLTFKDLDRLQKNGVGGFTTSEEQQALIRLAREGLKSAQHRMHWTALLIGLGSFVLGFATCAIILALL